MWRLIIEGFRFTQTRCPGSLDVQMDESSLLGIRVKTINYREGPGLGDVGGSLPGRKHGRLPV
jgi:hypothetical protein